MHLTIQKGIYLLLLFMFSNLSVADVSEKSAPPVKDIRVIIDMSGSMKKNDPHNHRTKAVQLFSTVLPDATLAGIWTFASEVNMLVKHQQVDEAWKKNAYSLASRIHSHGLYTNIEKALQVSTRDLRNGKSDREQHIILLTDGYIDIAKDKQLNEASRKRVIEDLLPALRNNGVFVHSIALSEHADHELMKALSYQTGGQYAVINNASDLDRYFFKLFQSTTRPDTVPFDGNEFEIDQSINDMTIVLFNQEYPTRIISPDNDTWTMKKHPDTVKWVKSDNYEIVTVSQPATGKWQVDAPADPDNKVMVVTNLRLHVDKLPHQLLPGEQLDLKIYLTEDDERITRMDFLKLVEINAANGPVSNPSSHAITPRYDGEGYYQASISTDGMKDHNLLKVVARSPTFTREFQHEFFVLVDPVIVESRVSGDGYALQAYIDDRALDKDKVDISIQDKDGPLALSRTGVKWHIDLPAAYAGRTLNIRIKSGLHDGRVFEKTLQTRLPGKQIEETPPAEQPPHDTAPAETATAGHENTPESTEETNTNDQQEPLNWWLIAIIVLLANLLIAVAGYFVYKKFFRSDASDDYLMLDQAEQQAAGSADSMIADSLDELEDLDDMNDLDSLAGQKS